jgi:hypothetical protein
MKFERIPENNPLNQMRENQSAFDKAAFEYVKAKTEQEKNEKRETMFRAASTVADYNKFLSMANILPGSALYRMVEERKLALENESDESSSS